MGKTFRQSMAWLHTWAGLTVGWLLYFIFLTGTVGYVNDEVDRWMRPEAPLVAHLPPAPQLAKYAQDFLAEAAPDSPQWLIQLPGDRYTNDLNVGWLAPSPDGRGRGQFIFQILDSHTGAPISYQPRETGGGLALYWMHFALYYVSRQVGALVVGICSMFMLVALLTGVVTHRRIFTDFFSFRPAKGQRSWLDAHNVVSITALPFHLMITWSGLLFFMFTYMPLGLTTLYPDQAARVRFTQEALTVARGGAVIRELPPSTDTAAVTLAPLAQVVANAEKVWGESEVATIDVTFPNRNGARVTARARRDLGRISRDSPALRFNPGTGEIIGPITGTVYTWPGGFQTAMIGLHKANFARPWLRTLFVFSGLASTAMIATGLILWSSKRKARLIEDAAAPFAVRAIDALNAATIVGLPIAIAVYFWANRLLPVGMADRAAWEMNCLFIGWGTTLVYAAVRARPWTELCLCAAGIYMAIPVLNALTTDRHLGVTIPAGDWVLAGFDLAMIAIGLAFGVIAWITTRGVQARAPSRRQSAARALEAV